MHKGIIMGEAHQAHPQDVVFVGHGSRWHNPFEFEEGEEGYLAFREWFHSPAYSAVRLRKGVLNKLQNKSLMCDCGDSLYCHASVLMDYLEDNV